MPRVDATFPQLRARHLKSTIAVLGPQFEAQDREVKARFDAGASVLLPMAWDERLGEVLGDAGKVIAAAFALRVAKAFDHDFDVDVMDAWLIAAGSGIAAAINSATRDRLKAADADRVSEVMTNLQTGGLDRHSRSFVSTTSNFGVHDAARDAGASAKRWNVTSANPRSSHARMNGQIVGMDDEFSNGLRWPGDSTAGAKDVANCKCSMTIL